MASRASINVQPVSAINRLTVIAGLDFIINVKLKVGFGIALSMASAIHNAFFCRNLSLISQADFGCPLVTNFSNDGYALSYNSVE
jgi:hypothetical protein